MTTDDQRVRDCDVVAFPASADVHWISGQHLLIEGGASLVSGVTAHSSGWVTTTSGFGRRTARSA